MHIFSPIITVAGIVVISSCAPTRSAIQPGTIPEPSRVSAKDEEYGHQVAYELSRQFPLDNNRHTNERVRRVVSRLGSAARGRQEAWKVFVYESNSFKNAAATKGNFVFVWTGLLDFVRNDAELATVLSHEMSHVLAGHTLSNPVEESRMILSNMAGQVGRQAVLTQGAGMGVAAGIAGTVIEESFKALLVNPELQRKEFEADQIGLFLMADAGYNPEEALNFWRRASRDPDLSGSRIDILSSHPSSDARERHLNEILPLAMERYYDSSARRYKSSKNSSNTQSPLIRLGRSVSRDAIAPVFEKTSVSSIIVGELPPRTQVKVVDIRDDWCEIEEPIPGFLRSSDLEERGFSNN